MKRVLIALAVIACARDPSRVARTTPSGRKCPVPAGGGCLGRAGMQVQVGGRPALRFFPGLHVTVADVRIRNRGADVASIGEVKLGIELRSLLHKDLKFQDVRFKNAKITIARDKDGRFNYRASAHSQTRARRLPTSRAYRLRIRAFSMRTRNSATTLRQSTAALR